jgi:carbonic anhydrase
MISASKGLHRLRTGNLRFVSGVSEHNSPDRQQRLKELALGQNPFAVVLGCSDSRVPPEIVFDQGLGELFVIRVAGNVVDRSQIASVELAVERCGMCLVVVLGHSSCEAVMATLEEIERPSPNRSPNVGLIVDRIRPSLQPLLDSDLRRDPSALLDAGVKANIRTAVNAVSHESDLLERRIRAEELFIVGAEYVLETGLVDFFDLPPNVGG